MPVTHQIFTFTVGWTLWRCRSNHRHSFPWRRYIYHPGKACAEAVNQPSTFCISHEKVFYQRRECQILWRAMVISQPEWHHPNWECDQKFVFLPLKAVWFVCQGVWFVSTKNLSHQVFLRQQRICRSIWKFGNALTRESLAGSHVDMIGFMKHYLV